MLKPQSFLMRGLLLVALGCALSIPPVALAQPTFILSYAVDTAGDVGRWPSLELDSQGLPHVCYFDQTTRNVKYARLVDGSWQTEVVAAADTAACSLALDASDQPHLSFYSRNGADVRLRYATRPGATWQTEDIALMTRLFRESWSTIRIDSQGRPHVAYLEGTGIFLGYAVRNAGVWSTEIADPNPVDPTGLEPDLILDDRDRPHVSFTRADADSVYLMYATKPDLVWQLEGVRASDETIGWASIALQADGRPAMAFDQMEGGTRNLYVGLRDGGGWNTFQLVDGGSTPSRGRPNSLYMDATGRALVSYYNLAENALKLATRAGSTWTSETIATAGIESSLELDAAGRPHIAYYDLSATDLAYHAEVPLRSIAVTPASRTIAPLETLQYTGSGTFVNDSVFDLTSLLDWNSTNVLVAAVNATGRASGRAPGSTTIEASSDGIVGRAQLVVGTPQGITFQYQQSALAWRLVAFPATATLQDIIDDFGAPGAESWRLGRWAPATSTYTTLENAGDALLPGQGFWLISTTARDLAVEGFPPSTDWSVLLDTGADDAPAWNQIGNPFDVASLPAANILVTQNGVDLIPILDASNTLTERSVKVWNATQGSYADATALARGEGAWVRRIAGFGPPVSVVFRFPGGAGAPGVAGVAGVAGATRAGGNAGTSPDAPPPGADWAIAVEARQGALAAERLLLGAAPVEPGRWNPLCASLAPAPPGDFLALHVPHDDWGRMNGAYVRDFRPASPTMSWEIVVRSGRASPGAGAAAAEAGAAALESSEVELTLTGLGLPPGTALALVDPESGNTFAPDDSGRVTLVVPEAERRIALVATLSGGTLRASAVAPFPVAYPSPFRAGTAFRLLLAEPGDLSVTIYAATGRAVRTLLERGAAPGEHILAWDGRDANGRDVPAGVYFARFRSGSVTGNYRVMKLR